MTADWMQHAACREPDVDPDWFYDEGSRYAKAREVCGRCPLATRDACTDAALAEEFGAHRYGYRGGLTPEQRTQLAKNRRQGKPYRPTAFGPGGCVQPLTPETARLRRELYDRGWNDTEIAAETGVTRGAITTWRQNAGLQPHSAIVYEVIAAERERLAKLGHSDAEIAEATGTDRRTIRKWRARRDQKKATA